MYGSLPMLNAALYTFMFPVFVEFQCFAALFGLVHVTLTVPNRGFISSHAKLIRQDTVLDSTFLFIRLPGGYLFHIVLPLSP